MDYDRMLEKMNPMNRNMFCILLGVTEPPEVVCKQYFAMKKCLDKISAPITPVDLLRIAMDCGFDVHTRRFVKPEHRRYITRPILEQELEGLNSDEESITVIGNPTEEQIEICKQAALEQETATEEAIVDVEVDVEPPEDPSDQIAEDGDGEPNKYEVGDTIQCYIEDDLVEARIQEVKAEVVPTVYVVEYGGNSHEITDMEIEEM
jgi:hypothetical protein